MYLKLKRKLGEGTFHEKTESQGRCTSSNARGQLRARSPAASLDHLAQGGRRRDPDQAMAEAEARSKAVIARLVRRVAVRRLYFAFLREVCSAPGRHYYAAKRIGLLP